MLNIGVLLFTLASHFGRSYGFAVPSATAPVIQKSIDEQTSVQTPPPILDLKARDRAGGLCGYYNGDAASAYICPSGYSCVQDHDNNAVGCVETNSNKGLMGVVYTTCLNYNVYSEYSVGPRTGCCMDPYLPYCAWNTYTGSEIEGFTIIQCGETYYPSPLHLAWDASTSGQSPTTMYVGLPTTGASTPASESTDKPTTPITPTPTPTDSPGGLSTSDKITLGTTLGLGLPATIAGIIGAWYGYKAWVNKKREDSGGGYASVANTLGDESMFSKPADQGQAGSRLLRMTS